MRNTTTLTSLVIQINLHWNDYDWIYVFDYFKKHPKLAATFATKWVNTKLLDYVPENKIRVRMSLMPEKMRAILENGTSPIIKEFSSWRSFSKQDTLRTSISVQLFTTTKN
jgi:spore photoproduct lyase